jgi:O-acetylhomoserine/O-acetylserine sulfhydrylase-like pyridoxal-dependent enzyme
MKIETKAIHVGDRKADPAKPGAFIPVTTPIYTAASYMYESTAQLDRVLAVKKKAIAIPATTIRPTRRSKS